VLSTDGIFMVFSEQELGQMIRDYRSQGFDLKEISRKITDKCKESYWKCRDNVTLVLVDLKKYFLEFMQA